MKKLRNKIFFTIITIISLCLLSILIIFNYQDYATAKSTVTNDLLRVSDFNESDQRSITEAPNQLFMDVKIYSVLYSDNEVIGVISHSFDSSENIKDEAQTILNNSVHKVYIGNLYFNRYSYRFNDKAYLKTDNGNYNLLVLCDNFQINNSLQDSLRNSLFIFILLECFIIFFARKITLWISKPVEESFIKQKQFIGDASHELKTPLAVIIASAEALENDHNEMKWLTNIESEADRMNHLILNLLDLARMDNDDYKIEMSETNLSRLIEMSCLTYESLLFEKGILMNYDIDENIMFNCNSDSMKQLVSILLDNAASYCEEHGDIDIQFHEIKDKLIFTVKNKGEGIPKGDEEKIFERFYRSDASRNRNTNHYGLGLAIAKSIVNNHNGIISCESKDGYTTFKAEFKKL